MFSGKILTGLTVSLLFWIGIVLVLLSVHVDFNDKAIATPISANLEELHPVEVNIPSPDMLPVQLPTESSSINSLDLLPVQLPAESSAINTEITGEIKKASAEATRTR